MDNCTETDLMGDAWAENRIIELFRQLPPGAQEGLIRVLGTMLSDDDEENPMHEPSEYPPMNQDDPNRPGPRDQVW